MPMIKNFIKSKNIDMNEIIEELKTESIELPEKEESEGEEMKEKDFIEEEEFEEEDFIEEEEFEEPEEFEENVEYAVPEDYEEPEQEEKPKTKKAADLEAKIADLCEKCAEEKNPFKLHINQFKIRGLIAKLQREIDKQNLKEEYALKRDRLARKRDRKEDDLVDSIAEMQEEVKYLERKLKGNKEYDYESKSFMYPKEYVEKAGGIGKFAEKLKTRDNESTQYAAKKMEQMAEVRAQLTEMKEKLKAEQEKLSNLDVKYENQEKKLKKEEKSLIIANNNPLNRLKGWFSNAFTEINAFFADRKDYKALKAEEKEAMKAMDEEFKRMRKEAKDAIKEESAKAQAEMKNAKLREFQEKSGIKVTEEQLIESNNSEPQPVNTNDLENEGIQNDQDNHEEPEGEEH